jgi:hypothetical protein
MAGSGADSYAQRLAALLGKPVIATDVGVFFNKTGSATPYPYNRGGFEPNTARIGTWLTFH